MNGKHDRFCPSDMGVRDSSIDGLPFQELERVINRLLEDCTPQEESYPLVPQPSTSASLPSIEDEKSRYFQQVSKSIIQTRVNFIELYAQVNRKIDDMMHRITACIENRERELKNQLKDIAEERIANWDRQLSVCKEALVRLQANNHSSSQNDSFIVNNEIFHDMKFLNAGDLKFEAENYTKIIKSLQKLGTIIYDNESSWRNCGISDVKVVTPKFIFGSSGDGPGQFCRPWGVCSDVTGRILICDRSNHRIQIFDERGDFLLQFGRQGSNFGEFNRPSGVEVDSKHRIIVADKDNHRIQVFTYFGKYIFSFGTQGTRPGQFMYPWDVAVNSKCDIAVSDSKNHRVQLFNEKGHFLTLFDAKKVKISNPRVGLRILDSPRGLAFRPNGTLLITDFNNHRILILNEKFNKFSSFGSEGLNPGQFFRPQGIACDKNGNVVVSDSKNYRIQVFDSTGILIKTFGSQGTEPGQFDCPQGICFHPNQNVIVIDFSNNRVQVF